MMSRCGFMLVVAVAAATVTTDRCAVFGYKGSEYARCVAWRNAVQADIDKWVRRRR
jgi:hypothetical protein